MRKIIMDQRAFALLPNILIIGFVALLIGATVLLLGLPNLKSSAVQKSKADGLTLNHGCAEEALFQIRQFSSYTGSGSVILNNKTCNYTVINLGGQNRRININSTVDKVVTKTQILLTIDASSTIAISSWKEVAEF